MRWRYEVVCDGAESFALMRDRRTLFGSREEFLWPSCVGTDWITRRASRFNYCWGTQERAERWLGRFTVSIDKARAKREGEG